MSLGGAGSAPLLAAVAAVILGYCGAKPCKASHGDFDARLGAGSSGILELRLPLGKCGKTRPSWFRVCHNSPNSLTWQAAVVTCRQIGFDHGALLRDPKVLEDDAVGSEAAWFRSLRCRGDEAHLRKCNTGEWKLQRCHKFAYVVCAPSYEKERKLRQKLEKTMNAQNEQVAELTEQLNATNLSRQLLLTEIRDQRQATIELQHHLQAEIDAKYSRGKFILDSDARIEELLRTLDDKRSLRVPHTEEVVLCRAGDDSGQRHQVTSTPEDVNVSGLQAKVAQLAEALEAERTLRQAHEAVERLRCVEERQGGAAASPPWHTDDATATAGSSTDPRLVGTDATTNPPWSSPSIVVASVSVATLILLMLTLAVFGLSLVGSPRLQIKSPRPSVSPAVVATSAQPHPHECHGGQEQHDECGEVMSVSGSASQVGFDFAHSIYDEKADGQITRFIKIQCPGVAHHGVKIELIFNGCIVSLNRPETDGLCKASWTRRFQFKVSDGLFEFKEDHAQIENGILQIAFGTFAFQSRMFRFPQHQNLSHTDMHRCWFHPGEPIASVGCPSSCGVRIKSPERFDIASSRGDSQGTQAAPAAASPTSSWVDCSGPTATAAATPSVASGDFEKISVGESPSGSFEKVSPESVGQAASSSHVVKTE